MKGQAPAVSVLMNCYNGSEFLARSLNSILAQTFSDWKIVFWDNCSTDSSEEIVKKIIPEYKLSYFRADVHTPLYEARNEAITKCTGEFIAFLDVDDEWESNKLEEQIKVMRRTQSAMSFTGFQRKTLNEEKNVIPTPVKNISDLIFNYNFGLLTLVARSEFLKANPFDGKLTICGDFDWVIRNFFVAKIDLLPNVYATYHVHDRNESSNYDSYILEVSYLIEKFSKGKEKEVANSLCTWLEYFEIFSGKSSLYRLYSICLKELSIRIKLKAIYWFFKNI
jgi:glycosyltransferase involved in cell wall biosynthesis